MLSSIMLIKTMMLQYLHYLTNVMLMTCMINNGGNWGSVLVVMMATRGQCCHPQLQLDINSVDINNYCS